MKHRPFFHFPRYRLAEGRPAEGRPEAGLPPHNEMKKGVERAFRKGNILKNKFWEGIL